MRNIIATSPDVGGDDTVDSDADPATGETAPFPVTINVLDTTIDAGFVVLPVFLPIFLDGFETGNSTRWFRFVVKGAAGAKASLVYRGQKVKRIETSTVLGP